MCLEDTYVLKKQTAFLVTISNKIFVIQLCNIYIRKFSGSLQLRVEIWKEHFCKNIIRLQNQIQFCNNCYKKKKINKRKNHFCCQKYFFLFGKNTSLDKTNAYAFFFLRSYAIKITKQRSRFLNFMNKITAVYNSRQLVYVNSQKQLKKSRTAGKAVFFFSIVKNVISLREYLKEQKIIEKRRGCSKKIFFELLFF